MAKKLDGTWEEYEKVKVKTLEIPLFTRSSDIRSLDECKARWWLEKIYADDLDEAGYFILGTGIHTGVEKMIEGKSLKWATRHVTSFVLQSLSEAEEEGKEVRWTKRRTRDTVKDDIKRMLEKWWKDVHPDSPDRIKRYNEFVWPPVVEHVIDVTLPDEPDIRLHTTVDAIFEHETGEFNAIVDWKSGATAKGNPMQLWTYRYGMQLEGDWELENAELWFHHIDHHKLEDALDYPGDAFVEDWIKTTQLYKEETIHTASPDWWCNYCRVKDKCPVFQGPTALNDLEDRLLSVKFINDPEKYYGDGGARS